MSVESLKASLRTVPDFPVKGILFWDVTTLFKDPGCLREAVDILYDYYKDKGITKVVGLEARGLVLAPALAIRLGAGLVMARKPGKLPAETYSGQYMKEYGPDTIEIHKDAISPDDVVLIHDDLLATGGTVEAVVQMMEKHFRPRKMMANFIIELEELNGRAALPADMDVMSVIKV
ncbi:MAG: adenine phosphoribosyltransferase [Bacteroidales bacterium]|nr:adenine phosphoribosyltransferase [Bacteroidales bacterium]